ncbi:MAG: rod shape-determining protein MreC [Bacteroidetes bacterium HGW-Bacteroidetes-1]|nr:MAG: rod shape-determining protein MreC [Bacteroidetes bacterium HGW-Bacteroidetes-1]
MYNLIRFVQKYNFILMFVLLEVLAIVMLSRSHTYHRAAISHVTNSMSGRIYRINSGITAYFSLRNVNNKLKEQNAVLLRKLSLLEARLPFSDTLNQEIIFDYLPAKVISNTIQFRNNYIMIDKGYRDGVKKDMGLISPEGVVGIIIGVSEHYSSAMSLLHKYATLSVRFLNSDQIANLHWGGGNYQFGEIVDIPTHVALQKGDTIVTSGHSFVFPEGLIIGTVEEFIPSEKGNLNTASIKFSVDFNKLRNVFIVKNFHREEQDALMKIKTNE